MIFVTVGAQTPFDRLIRAVDQWAAQRARTDVVAQIGQGRWIPQHAQWMRFITPADFRGCLRAADLVIAHAGTGSIFAAMEFGKPIVVMPRRAALGETRNDHQLATVRRLAELSGVTVARDEQELVEKLDRSESMAPAKPIGPYASPRLLAALRRFVTADAPHSHL